MASESVNLAAVAETPDPNLITDPMDPRVRQEFFEEGWETVKLPMGVTGRLCRAERALTGLSGVLDVLTADRNSREFADNHTEEPFEGLIPALRWKLEAAVRELADVARYELLDLRENPEYVEGARHPRARD